MVLSIDTLRADRLGSCGYERTPALGSTRERGHAFSRRVVTRTLDTPDPQHHALGPASQPSRCLRRPYSNVPDTLVLPEVFGDAGYNTAGVVATMFVSSKYGFERGFDYFQDFGVMDKKTNNLSTDAEHVFSHALDWAQEQPAQTPLFTFSHVYDVHYGYNAPRRGTSGSTARQRLAMRFIAPTSTISSA